MPSSRRFTSEDVLNTPSAYDVLGVPTNASAEQIMQAYRTSLQHTHPDGRTRQQQTYTLEAIRAAFEILRDPVARREYDQGLQKARKLAVQARRLKAINDNAHAAGDQIKGVSSTIGAIFWPFKGTRD